MNTTTQARTVSTIKRVLTTAALSMGAVLIALTTTPADVARAALPTTTVGGTTVTITELDKHNWSRLSPTNPDTTMLQDGSRGEVWTFDVGPGQCLDITMRSDDFSPYLSLRQGAPFGEEVAKDDGNGDTWAAIRGTVGSSGPYYLTATSSGSGEVAGKYTLDIQRC